MNTARANAGSIHEVGTQGEHPARGAGVPTLVVVGIWLAGALAASLLGAFDSAPRPPLPLGGCALAPVVVFGVLYTRWPAFRRLALSADPRLITLAQTWRAGGFVFLILHARGLLPASFALPAGWGDIAIGVTAPLVAWLLGPGRRLPAPVFAAWNVLGIADLVMAVTLGVLSSEGPAGILAGEATTRIMGQFPLSLIPTFLVPLFVILHLIALLQGRRAVRDRVP